MNWEVASALGIRRFYPFFNREAIELAFAVDSHELIGPGTKKLLKNALRADVPHLNLDRADKGSWGSAEPAGSSAASTTAGPTISKAA
jgi:hypothetical protein